MTQTVAAELEAQGHKLVEGLGGHGKATTFAVKDAEGHVTSQAVLDGTHLDAFQKALSTYRRTWDEASDTAQTTMPPEAREAYVRDVKATAENLLNKVRQALLDNPFDLPTPPTKP